uniref:GDSL esterase/lipase EXL3 n=1 Tax=Kalanchoe fedtschenkoi TaxID=63787 RepID=A0A7N0ZR41_KALFE
MDSMRSLFFRLFLLKTHTTTTIKCVLVVFGVMLSWCVGVAASVQIPEDKRFPALLVFGDSIVDPGNNNHMITAAKADYPPYGKDFKGGIPSGRFSNGKIPGDIIAKELSLKEYLPAYRDPSLQPDDLITGVSFASGGCGYDPLTSLLAPATTLAQQLDMFREYRSKLYSLVGENQTSYIIGRGLFGVVASSNDIVNSYYISGIRRAHYDISSYTTLMASFAADFFADLYAEGARRIGIFTAPPLGCIPFTRTTAGGFERECVEEYNQAAVMFNSKLGTVIDSFNTKYRDAKAVIVDVYNPLLSLVKNPRQNGFEVADKGCCGTGLIEAVFLCSPVDHPKTCPDASKYVFWDSFHPTETTYKELIAKNIGIVLPQFF